MLAVVRSQLRRQMVYGMHDISQEYTVDGIYAWTLVTTMYPSAAWNLFGTYWALFGIQLNTRNMLRSHLAGYSSRMIQWEPSVFYVVQVSRKVRRIMVVECKKVFPENSRIFQILENPGKFWIFSGSVQTIRRPELSVKLLENQKT